MRHARAVEASARDPPPRAPRPFRARPSPVKSRGQAAAATAPMHRASIVILRQDRQRKKLDTLLAQSLRLFGGGLAMDAARRRFLVVDLACLVGKARANVFRL